MSETDIAKKLPAEEKPDGPASEKRPLVDLEALLSETEQMADHHEQQIADIAEMAAEFRSAVSQMEFWRKTRKSRSNYVKACRNKTEGLDLSRGLTKETMDALVNLNLLSGDARQNLMKLDEMIERLGNMKDRPEELEQRLQTLIEAKRNQTERLQNRVDEMKEGYEERRKNVLERVIQHCNKRTSRLGLTVAKYKDNPEVIEKAERDDLMEEIGPTLQSLTDRQKAAIAKMGEAIGDANFEDTLYRILELDGKEHTIYISNLRCDIAKAIKAGKIASPGMIIPWRSKSGKKYEASLYALREPKMRERINRLVDEPTMVSLRDIHDFDDAMRRLFGRETDGEGPNRNGQVVKKPMSLIWKAFADMSAAGKPKQNDRQ